MEMEVDIISMSWSFKSTRYNDRDETEFRNLIWEAARKNIILFASLPDKALEDTSQFAPVSLEGVIRIGSATVFGESCKENKYAQPDFLLPGEGIILSTGEMAKGSSFSTAYASGLAASLLYCLKAHRVLFQPGEENPYHKALRIAKTAKGMKGIFKRLGSSTSRSSDEATFVQPYRHFPHEFGVSADDLKANLQEIVTRIMSAEDLRQF